MNTQIERLGDGAGERASAQRRSINPKDSQPQLLINN